MRMKTKTYEINFVVVKRLWLNIFSCKLFATKKKKLLKKCVSY